MFQTAELVDAVDPFKLVLEIPRDQLPHIYLDCGTEDFPYQSARDFTQLMLDNNIPFTCSQSGGTHMTDYWAREIQMAMAAQYSTMLKAIWGKEFPQYKPWEDLYK